MATRFYLQNSIAADISPAFSTEWTGTTSADRLWCDTEKCRTAMANKTVTMLGGSGAEFELARMYVSDPLQEQDISGTVKGQIRCVESLTTNNATVAITIRLVDGNDGANLKTLLALTASDDTTATPPEFATSLTNRKLQDASESASLTLTAAYVPEGSRLVIELGVREVATAGTASLNFGDDSATDLAEDNTTTTANNPWIEFSQTLVFNNSGWKAVGGEFTAVWTDAFNAETSNDVYTTTATQNDAQRFGTFGLDSGVSATATVLGFRARVEGLGDSSNLIDCPCNLQISINNGSTFSSSKAISLTSGLEVLTFSGSSVDNWGLVPIKTSLADSQFQLKIIYSGNPVVNDLPLVDCIWVKAYWKNLGETRTFFPIWKWMSPYLKNTQSIGQTSGPGADGAFNPGRLDP